MIKNKTAVIIGAGIGGIATAVYLAKNGYEVCVYEKNLSPGGRCGQLIRDGHRFDLGATMLLMPGVYRQVFGSLGHNMMQMGYFRPHNRHDKYHNLYFVGGSTHPGNGIPNILMSSKLVAERIMSGK